ncbi:hypothetical protein [Roseovarius sp. MMSF_3350]|uniref:hypothetical protein n=1 Tax=Roseovarius sp. MMSF_3350 TaxID=3046706 RepID=UPI00274022F8|nr:hypothetical protein [Roseovarius sp. MMSF_3350]
MVEKSETEKYEPVTVGVETQILGRAVEALIALSDDLEAELRARYPEEVLKYASEARRYRRDMQAVQDGRRSIQELNRIPGFCWVGDD